MAVLRHRSELDDPKALKLAQLKALLDEKLKAAGILDGSDFWPFLAGELLVQQLQGFAAAGVADSEPTTWIVLDTSNGNKKKRIGGGSDAVPNGTLTVGNLKTKAAALRALGESFRKTANNHELALQDLTDPAVIAAYDVTQNWP